MKPQLREDLSEDEKWEDKNLSFLIKNLFNKFHTLSREKQWKEMAK